MADYYGNNVTNSYSGSSYTWRNWTTYNYSQTDSTFTVSFAVRFHGTFGTSAHIHLSAGNFSAFLQIAGATVSSFTSSSDKELYGGTANAWVVISYSRTYDKTHSAQSLSVATQCKGVSPSNWKGTSNIGAGTFAISIPAKTSYAVSYNANGGSGTIANSTKWYGESLTLSDGSGFTRAHYTLNGWNTSADGTGTHYDLGSAYTANAGTTLYAEWKLNCVSVRTKVAGAIKSGILYVKVNNAIKIPYAGFVKVNGTWKRTKE